MNFSDFKQAVKYGHADVVAMLLNDSRIAPRAENNILIKKAVTCCHAEVVKLLLVDFRIDP